jgi:hypothetical protein
LTSDDHAQNTAASAAKSILIAETQKLIADTSLMYLSIVPLTIRAVWGCLLCRDSGKTSFTGMSSAMITRYSRHANQKRLARAAARRLEGRTVSERKE